MKRNKLAVLTLIFGLILAATLAACGDTATPATNNSTGAIPGDGGAAAANATKAADAYASYTPQQVIDTYLKAYQAEDFETCKALIAPVSQAAWQSPDEFDLKVKALDKKGKFVLKTYGVSDDEGSKITYGVTYQRVPTGNQSTPTQGVRLGDAATAVPASPTPLQDLDGSLTVVRTNNTWKIETYSYM